MSTVDIDSATTDQDGALMRRLRIDSATTDQDGAALDSRITTASQSPTPHPSRGAATRWRGAPREGSK